MLSVTTRWIGHSSLLNYADYITYSITEAVRLDKDMK